MNGLFKKALPKLYQPNQFWRSTLRNTKLSTFQYIQNKQAEFMNKHFLAFLFIFFASMVFSTKSVSRDWGQKMVADTMRKSLEWFNKKDTIQVAHVCGTDGQTYLNAKEAAFFGVYKWSEGACKSYKKTIAIQPDAMWITEVNLNEMKQTSQFEPDGYTNFNNVMMEVYADQENTFILKKQDATMTKKSCLKVWIDYNENGHFEASELVVSQRGKDCIKPQKFRLPPEIPYEFTTIMRVFYGTTDEAPESGFIEKGEVEDYSLIVY